jgi:hypothetical protein
MYRLSCCWYESTALKQLAASRQHHTLLLVLLRCLESELGQKPDGLESGESLQDSHLWHAVQASSRAALQTGRKSGTGTAQPANNNSSRVFHSLSELIVLLAS